jgi:hypothetical protein
MSTLNGEKEVQAAPIYEPRAVAFLDILGFSDMIVSGGAEREIAELFEVLRKRAGEVERGISRAGRMQFTAFSDSIVVSEDVMDGVGTHRIAGYAAYLTLELLARGFLVRGGLSTGDLYHRDGTVFGPALIDAYQLESKVALFPRLAVSAAFRESVLNGAATEKLGLALPFGLLAAHGLFRTDFDGVVHIDIFGPFVAAPQRYYEASGIYQSPLPGEPGVAVTPEVMARAARNSVRRTRDLRYKEGAKQKYDWMDRYLAEATIRNQRPT